MKYLFRLFAYVMVVTVFGACSMRNPRFINNPMSKSPSFLTKKGESRFSANVSILPQSANENTPSDRISRTIGGEFDIAYAFSDKFFVNIGGSYKKEKDFFLSYNDILETKSPNEFIYKRKSLRFGSGAMIPLSKVLFFSPEVGVSLGEMKSKTFNRSDTVSNNTIFKLDGDFVKFHVSPAFKFIFNENFKLSISNRVTILNYKDIATNYPQKRAQYLLLKRLSRNTRILFEPTFFVQIGYPGLKWVKFDLGITNSLSIWNSEESLEDFYTRGAQLSAGFTFYPHVLKF